MQTFKREFTLAIDQQTPSQAWYCNGEFLLSSDPGEKITAEDLWRTSLGVRHSKKSKRRIAECTFAVDLVESGGDWPRQFRDIGKEVRGR